MLDPIIRAAATAKNFAVLSLILPNGEIATHVMWVDADDEHVLINTEVHRAKYKGMMANPKVTVTIMDGADPYHYVEVRGRVTGEIRGPEAMTSIHALSHKYTDSDYAGEIKSERVIVQITPDHFRVFGH